MRIRHDFAIALFSLMLGLTTIPAHAQPSSSSTGGMTFYSSPATTPAQQSLTGPHTLSGTVIDSVTGEPIRRAQVQLNGARQDALLTDSSGRFSFEKLPPGTYSVHCARPGYLSTPRSSIVVQVGPKSSGQAVLALSPVATIEGTINDVQGEPLDGISVSALRSQVVDGRRKWIARGSSQTDGEGHYRISGLEPGVYLLKTSSRSHYAEWRIGDAETEGYRGVYFPSANDRASATKLQLTTGQRVSADFELHVEPMYRVSGSMQYDGQWAFINAIDSEGESVSNASVNPESGRFDLHGLVSGSYQLRGEAITESGERSTAMVSISVGPSRSDLTLAVRPEQSIRIKARWDSSEQTSGAAANLLQAAASSIRLEDVSGHFSLVPMMTGTTASGEVSLRHISPGRYNAELNWFSPCSINGDEVSGAAYVSSMRSGSVDLFSDPLTIDEGGQPEPIEIVLRDDAAALFVQIANAAHFAQPVLIAVPDDGDRAPVFRPLFSIAGAAPEEVTSAVCGLAPGGYSVTVVENAGEIEYRNPEALNPLLTNATHVQLTPKRVAKIKIRIDAVASGD